MRGSLEDWTRLIASPTVIAAAADADPHDAAAVSRLRRDHDAHLVALALDLASARRKAARKWPGRSVVADPEGVEMATGEGAGAHKAARFAAHGTEVLDLCCGIGGDAMAMAAAGLRVHGVDRSDVRSWMCAQNASCETSTGDVTSIEVNGLYHLDPVRRSAGRRLWRYEDLEPGPDVVARLARCNGAIKLGPGVDTEALPSGEIEMISEHGVLTHAVLWTGDLATHARKATVFPAGASIAAAAGEIGAAPAGDVHSMIHAVDASVERSGLMGLLADRLGCSSPHPRLGILTSDQPVDSPFVTSFALVERMPWRLRRVASWLDAHDAGIVEVKTRGRAVDPDEVQQRLRGRGSTRYTVFVLRFDRRVEALVTRRT